MLSRFTCNRSGLISNQIQLVLIVSHTTTMTDRSSADFYLHTTSLNCCLHLAKSNTKFQNSCYTFHRLTSHVDVGGSSHVASREYEQVEHVAEDAEHADTGQRDAVAVVAYGVGTRVSVVVRGGVTGAGVGARQPRQRQRRRHAAHDSSVAAPPQIYKHRWRSTGGACVGHSEVTYPHPQTPVRVAAPSVTRATCLGRNTSFTWPTGPTGF